MICSQIFNWVHRKLYQKGEVGAKNEVAGNARDKVALLENAALDGVFDGWKEGILAIGTFGLDPSLFKDFVPDQDDDDHMYLCEIVPKESLVEYEREMEFPLMLKACKHGFFGDQKPNDDHHHHPQCDDETCKPNDYNDNEDGLEFDQVKKESSKAGERITLADLFWADSEKNLLKNKIIKLAEYDKDHDTSITESNTKHASKNDDRVGLISKKKLTKGDAARPIKKINRLVRKMLKKKIHPEVENQKEIARRKTMRILGSVKNEY
ncbi:hypothetical protein OSB04_031830 [Centaurea solstitialis]|uniref:Protein TILLER ANGLE CONTROL 1 n=1 Tax=Centaurea solstitialis TaxID=347529 RepID=A0AA38STT4_9ASTR|nr:hypothetical protein OSB04_031830 [Centaurea solstitialis]